MYIWQKCIITKYYSHQKPGIDWTRLPRNEEKQFTSQWFKPPVKVPAHRQNMHKLNSVNMIQQK